MFTYEELEALQRFPEIGREDLFRFFTLAPADRLGLAVAVCRCRGWVRAG